MAQREEEADPNRLVAVLKQLAGRVVDGRDVVGVERVPQPERVREAAEGKETGMLHAVAQEQPPAGEVEHNHRPVEAGQAGALTFIEGPPDQRPGRGHDRSLNVIAT